MEGVGKDIMVFYGPWQKMHTEVRFLFIMGKHVKEIFGIEHVNSH